MSQDDSYIAGFNDCREMLLDQMYATKTVSISLIHEAYVETSSEKTLSDEALRITNRTFDVAISIVADIKSPKREITGLDYRGG